ncbi:MAG: DUF1638 domain-containing protein [Flavonifractor plautii]
MSFTEVSYLASQSKQITSFLDAPGSTIPRIVRKTCSRIDRLDLALENGTPRHRPDYLLLCYGLCSNGWPGFPPGTIPWLSPVQMTASESSGIASAVSEIFRYPGTYRLNNGWPPPLCQAAKIRSSSVRPTRSSMARKTPTSSGTADCLGQTYSACGYITSQVCDLAPYREEAKDVAQRNHWNFREIPGDITFLARLLDGDFREEEVLLCPPGKTVTPSYDAKKLTFL